MHHRGTVKKVFKVAFFFIQTTLFVSGISLLVVATTLYAKAHDALQIPLRMLVFAYILGILEILSAAFGYTSLASKRRLRMFVYICATLVLMNVQVIVAIKSALLRENSYSWATERWTSLSNDQKNFIQTRFRCCGLLSPADRPGTTCGAERGCIPVVFDLSKAMATVLQRILLFSFFFESMGMGILTMLRLRR